MSDGVKGFLTVLVATVMGALVMLAIGLGTQASFWGWLVLAGVGFGLLYGLEAGILLSYDLSRGVAWVALLVDLTWSLPNTVFGFVFGNLIYIFFGNPDRNASKGDNWIVFLPRSTTGFGRSVLQTLGTVNLGGAGQHELMHVLQARIFGPTYLVLFALFYIVTFSVQVLWTATLGWILKVAGARQTAWFRPPARSAVQGFFGWIYYATPFELWAYASGNP
jgi:hypothetical protein